jgi:hypothetical protein
LIDYNNNTGWILKPSDYPSGSCTSFEEYAPSPPQGREITTQILLAPCKISFFLLLKTYEYEKFQFLRRDHWTKAMAKVYLWTCCMSSDVSENLFIMVNEVKKNNAPKTIISPPVLWLEHEELGIKIEQFSDIPMHMLLGTNFLVFKHFAESYQSISNLAKISLSNGVQSLVLQKLSQYQPPVGNLLNTLPFHACC